MSVERIPRPYIPPTVKEYVCKLEELLAVRIEKEDHHGASLYYSVVNTDATKRS